MLNALRIHQLNATHAMVIATLAASLLWPIAYIVEWATLLELIFSTFAFVWLPIVAGYAVLLHARFRRAQVSFLHRLTALFYADAVVLAISGVWSFVELSPELANENLVETILFYGFVLPVQIGLILAAEVLLNFFWRQQ